MYLKQLYLRGFKTFAEPTTLDFDDGITAIVGPNGVGKSNIVDALLWALGEQSPRTLRTSSLQEVIFAGTEDRRPLGMAEVTVTLDNSDGALPTDYVEVAITRRLFRSGQSEYLMNRTAARLRDVRDLLLDTGLGPEAYSVIGQGQIDAILSVRPEDRRELIEEAAGVRKYRVRRDEAERRLENARSELRRLRDIISELSSHLQPLEIEADRARKYSALDERLRELEMQLFAAEYAARKRRRGRLENDRAVAQQELSELRERLKAAEHDLIEGRRELEAAQARVEELRDTVIDLERKVEDLRRRRDLAHHQRTSLVQQLEVYQQSEEEALRHKQEVEQRTAALEQELAAVREELARARDDHARAEQRRHDLEEQARRLAAERQQRDRLISSLTEKISRAEQEALGLEGLESELRERISRVKLQIEQMQRKHAELMARRGQIERELEKVRAGLTEAQEEAREAEQAHRRSRRLLDEHRAKLRLLRENRAAVEAVLKTLDQLARSRETLSEASAAVLQAADVGRLEGILGPVAALIEVPFGLEAAIATALGERAQWVVVQDRRAALAAAELVLQRELGRLGLLILDELAPAIALPPEAEDPRAMGWAADLVKAQEGLEGLVRHLLGDVVLVDTLPTAMAVRSAASAESLAGGSVRLVTLGGEMIGATGELVVGGPAEKQSPALAQARDRRRAQERRERLAKSETGLVAVEQQLQAAAEAAAQRLDALRASLSEQRVAFKEAEGQLANLCSSLEAAEQAIKDMSSDLALLESRAAKAAERRSLALETAEGLRAELETLEREPLTGASQDVGKQLAAAHEEAVAAQIRVAQLEQRLEASRQEHQRNASLMTTVAKQLESAQGRTSELTARLAEVEETLGSLPEVEPLEQRLAAARAAADRERERARALAQRQADLEESLARSRASIDRAGNALHQAELSLAREEAHLADLAQRLQDQFSVSPDIASEGLDESFNRTAAQSEAEKIKAQMRELGPVNLGAPDELERVRARHEYLQSQMEDVTKARDEILGLIAELDQVAKEEFLRAFDQVGEAFSRTFSWLFNGGETKLELTNSEEPLEGGVDIIVRPPGKRLQNMMLLSGGEKALTAMAFIFALLEVRPSPFCVLDEIDAALDASSTDRFIELLQDFAKRSQFIVVTHNPQTVTAATQLYGVTMQTPGVSMVLRVELEQAQDMAREGRLRPQLRVAPAT